ncbi:MAG: hypothetical protein K6F92_06600 [Lachnospiraceae bacterium]|nr:hypothetical protein [Lachnospiraceae bacterium]
MVIVCVISGVVLILSALVMFVPGLSKIYESSLKRGLSDVKLSRIRAVNVRKPTDDYIRREGRIRLVIVMAFALLVLALGIAQVKKSQESGRILSVNRPEFGQGSEEMVVVAQVENETLPISITVGEKIPDDAQTDHFFEVRYMEAVKVVLGQNSDFDHVEHDLNLITGMADGTEIEWTISNTALMNIMGELSDDIAEGGEKLTLIMTMSYAQYSRSFEICATVYKAAAVYAFSDELTDYVNEAIADSEEDCVKLPQTYNDSEISYENPQDETFTWLMALSLIAALLLWLVRDNMLENAYKKRNIELMIDYPQIVSKLSILFSAGLAIPTAWDRLVRDYEYSLGLGERSRFGFEEMRITALEMKNTGYREGVFENFGKRCDSYSYRKLGSILDQSMKLGTVNLSTYMQQEAAQAFELRKQTANRIGEEAGTKLLLPMMLLFALVLVMVVVPAWIGMNM